MNGTPRVCALMLVDGREAMVRRAIKSFRDQTYQNKVLFALVANGISHLAAPNEFIARYDKDRPRTIGELRNAALEVIKTHPFSPDIICHWDSDDWSHPMRIEEQVAQLQKHRTISTVGYTDMLFWRTTHQDVLYYRSKNPLDLIGSSLCYWRTVWERQKFKHTSQGEDTDFIAHASRMGFSSLYRHQGPSGFGHDDLQPRMICTIHPGNTSNGYSPANLAQPEWAPAPQYYGHVVTTMSLSQARQFAGDQCEGVPDA